MALPDLNHLTCAELEALQQEGAAEMTRRWQAYAEQPGLFAAVIRSWGDDTLDRLRVELWRELKWLDPDEGEQVRLHGGRQAALYAAVIAELERREQRLTAQPERTDL